MSRSIFDCQVVGSSRSFECPETVNNSISIVNFKFVEFSFCSQYAQLIVHFRSVVYIVACEDDLVFTLFSGRTEYNQRCISFCIQCYIRKTVVFAYCSICFQEFFCVLFVQFVNAIFHVYTECNSVNRQHLEERSICQFCISVNGYFLLGINHESRTNLGVEL